VGNLILLAKAVAKSTKISWAQEFLYPDQQQVFILEIHRDKRKKSPAAPQKTEERPKMMYAQK
jgi:hypothetical protein